MQSKVSMVMPCYNKQDYIGIMLESIKNQVWDNIELILVNDGSTDNTRAVISEWVPRLRERGFEVIVVDQENAGVISAARAGLEHITGDFVCQVDADDELDPVYVSTMAGFLENHRDYDYAICDFIMCNWLAGRKYFGNYQPATSVIQDECAVEHTIVNHLFINVWRYMLRTDYFRKCGVIANYTTESRWSHEPGYVIPIRALNGNFKHFQIPLYHFCSVADSMSNYRSFEYFEKYHLEHAALLKESILSLPEQIVGMEQKQKLLSCTDFSHAKHVYMFLGGFSDGPAHRERVIQMLLDYTNTHFNTAYTHDQITGKENDLVRVISNILTNKRIPSEFPGRVIVYGAMGVRGARVIPQLLGTAMEPALLWDAAAGDTPELFGIPLEQPNVDSLLETDTVLVLPADKTMITEIYDSLKRIKLNDIIFYDGVCEYILHNVVFPLHNGGKL